MLSQAFTAASFCCLFRGVFPFNLLRRWNAYSIGLRSGDGLRQSKTFHFFTLMKSFVVLAVCIGSLSCCMMKCLPKSLDAFLRKLADGMFLLASEFILLLPSWVTSSIKISEPTPEAAMQAILRFSLYIVALEVTNNLHRAGVKLSLTDILGVFFTALTMFRSSTAVVVLGRPARCLLLSTPAVSSLFRTFQVVVEVIINACAIALIDCPLF